MRCPDCNKFVSLDTSEPEIDSIDVVNDDDGMATVNASVTITRQCAECGQDLKSANLEIQSEGIGLSEDNDKETDDTAITEEGAEKPERFAHETHALSITGEEVALTESGGGRYAKNMIGAEISGAIQCNDCDVEVATFQMADSVAASEFEEMV